MTDVVVLDVRTLVDYADAFVVMTGQSARQNLAIAEHIVRSMKAEQKYAISKSGLDSGSWICLDLGDIVVHVFDPETRARYDLELLWADAPRVELGAAPVPLDDSGIPPNLDGPAEAVAEAGADAAEGTKKPNRRRAVRRAAVEEADAENAPDSERPADGELEAESGSTPDDAEESDVPTRKGAPKPPSKKDVKTPKRASNAGPPAWMATPPAAEKWIPIRSVPARARVVPTEAAVPREAQGKPARLSKKRSPAAAPTRSARTSKPAAAKSRTTGPRTESAAPDRRKAAGRAPRRAEARPEAKPTAASKPVAGKPAAGKPRRKAR